MSVAVSPSPTRTQPGLWLRSPIFDLAFFLAPIGLGLAYYLFVRSFPELWYAVSAAFFIVLAYGHYSLTFSFYFDAEHAPYYREHKGRYYVMPALFAATVIAGYVVIPWLFFAIDYILTQHHCTKQSTGICGLYRHRSGAFSPRNQRLENAAVYLACSALVAHGLFRLRLVDELLGFSLAQTSGYDQLSLGILAAVGLFCLAVLLRMIWQARQAAAPRSAHIWFWLTSVAMYTPILYVPVAPGKGAALEALRTVIIISLTQHWLQYYGIVYLHGSNKYNAPEHRDQRVAPWLARLPRMLLAAVAFGLLLGAFRFTGLKLDSALGRAAFGVVLGVGWVHYWLDRQIWAFKVQHNRETILPYLKS